MKKTQQKLKQKIKNLKQLLTNIEKKKFLSENAMEYFRNAFSESDIPSALIKRYLKNRKIGSTTRDKYPAAIRKFAMTLQFYSTKAYKYVRQTLGLALPNIVTIRKWCTSIKCEPGFLKECFQTLKQKSLHKKNILCSLIFDEMSIKKKLDFDGKRIWGYTDYGTRLESDNMDLATEVLVLMVVCHTEGWKLPIAYFFIKTLNAKEKANIINEALIRLHEVGIDITSVTCDGPATHFSMFEILGCDWSNKYSMKTYFKHPRTNEKVYAIFDACHMLKLIRNNFASLGTIFNEKNEKIQWNYLEKLHNLQDKEGLKIANKIGKRHIYSLNQKMKVTTVFFRFN